MSSILLEDAGRVGVWAELGILRVIVLSCVLHGDVGSLKSDMVLSYSVEDSGRAWVFVGQRFGRALVVFMRWM